MRSVMRTYVRVVDAVNYRLGRIIMYGIFVMMGILLWSSISKTFFLPSFWALGLAPFAMVSYFFMGGSFSILLGWNVRMDLFYGNWSTRKKAWFDAFTVMLLIFYIGVLLYGAIGSNAYSLGYWGKEPISFFTGLVTGPDEMGRLESSSTAWRPYFWPVKSIMVFGFFLMLLQAFSALVKDIATLKGIDLAVV